MLDTIDATALPRCATSETLAASETLAKKKVTKTGAVQDGANFLRVIADWETFAEALGPRYVNGEDISDVYWQIIIGGCAEEEYDEVRTEYLRLRRENKSYGMLRKCRLTRFRLVCLLLLGFITLRVVILAHLKMQWAIELAFLDRMVVCTGRRMFRTGTGRLGLGPAACREGDRVALFRGGNMPLVLRADGGSWRLVGAAYVHGIMYGEAFDDKRCKTMQVI